jgi:hypothetical protein
MNTKMKWVLAGVLMLALGGVALGDDIQAVQIQVNALRMLRELRATPDQLRAVQQLSADTQASMKNVEAADPHATTAPSYTNAIKSLHDALLSEDDGKIEKAQDTVDDLEEKHDIDSDSWMDSTEPAREKANEAIKLFSAGQIANFIAVNSDDFPEPAQTLLSALQQCRGGSMEDFTSLRDDTAKEIAALMAGGGSKHFKAVAKSVTDLLNKVRDLSDSDFTTQRADLEKTARDLTAADPVEILRHWLHFQMANLLSNPQLSEVLNDKLNHVTQSH